MLQYQYKQIDAFLVKINSNLVHNLDYFSEYYIINNINFDSTIEKNFNKLINIKNSKRYNRFNVCTSNLINNQDNYIIYNDAGISSCKPILFKKTFSKLSIKKTNNIIIDSDFVLRIQYNIYSKYFFKTPKAINLVNEYLTDLPKKFNGIHVRTYGYFNDFNERTTDLEFNISKIDEYFLDSIKTKKVKNYYIASDSIKMKKYIDEFGKLNNIFVFYSNKNVSHSRNNRKFLERNVFYELEVMSMSLELLLTNLSSFSMLILFKNKNCFIYNKCLFMNFYVKRGKDYDTFRKRYYI